MTFARRSRKRLAKTRRTPGRYAAELFFKLMGFLYFVCYRANNAIDVSRYERVSPKVPAAFDGFRVVQVSDLHGKVFGRDNAELLKLVEREKPDLIVVTGDVVDERNFRLDSLRDFAERLVKIAPVFYIVGNHEADLYAKYFYEVVATLRKSGFTLLLDREKRVTRRNGDAIVVAGLMDVKESRKFANIARPQLNKFSRNPDEFRILLSHRPEWLSLYAEYEYDLVFSGHAHGGQIRIPGLLPNGLNAPGQGWFPKYTGGAHTQGETTMIVSRGLGPSVIPTRLFNRPELVVCVLKRETRLQQGMANDNQV